uniref:Uncharacterized protein n=1 Tax=Arundo donax TaxID=35708 RepID=A0A0A9FPG5_ARUDO
MANVIDLKNYLSSLYEKLQPMTLRVTHQSSD